MLQSSISVDASVEPNKLGPDYFGFFVNELGGLLSGCKDMCISSQASDDQISGGSVGGKTKKNDTHNKESHLFSDSIGTSLPEINRERLHSLLRQSAAVLSKEVDEVVDPVFSIYKIKKECGKYKKSLANAASNGSKTDNDDPPLKRVRLSISTADSSIKKLDVSLPTKVTDDVILKGSASHPGTRMSEPLRNSNGSRLVEQQESLMVESDTAIEKENRDIRKCPLVFYVYNIVVKLCSVRYPLLPLIDDELQLLLESDSSEVENVMKRHADEYQATIEHMESMLEKLLHIVASTCRSMTRPEKHTLKKLIQNLLPENLERVAEIIQHSRPVVNMPFAEMHVDLEKEDNVTLWRLYYYVKAVERARQQC